MKAYRVEIPMTGVLHVDVEAESQEEAVKKAYEQANLSKHLHEMDVHTRVTEGNICHAIQNAMDVYEIEQIEEPANDSLSLEQKIKNLTAEVEKLAKEKAAWEAHSEKLNSVLIDLDAEASGGSFDLPAWLHEKVMKAYDSSPEAS